MERVPGPALPPGRKIELPGRGRTFIREVAGPPGAPTLLLLHGLAATADLNWFRCYAPLGRRYNVVALDHRGHGRGIRSLRNFRLQDCADDAAAVVRTLDLDRVIAVGYSMGGPIAQFLWKRHRDLVDGLVLCATSRSFTSGRPARMLLPSMVGLSFAARAIPSPVRRQVFSALGRRMGDDPGTRWAMQELRRTDQAAVLQAASAIGGFDSRSWIGQVDVPTGVVVTTHDQLVPPTRQIRLAESIPDARMYKVPADHGACVTRPDLFVPALLRACDDVSARLRSSVRP